MVSLTVAEAVAPRAMSMPLPWANDADALRYTLRAEAALTQWITIIELGEAPLLALPENLLSLPLRDFFCRCKGHSLLSR